MEHKDNFIEEKTFGFALRIVKLYKCLKEERKEYVMSKQVLRSGTSIGANVCEAQEAQSRADFVSKMNIALKESAETEYWLKLLNAAEYITEKEYSSLRNDCKEIIRLLTSIVKTSKNKT